jgi:DNA-binding SARP family transcriptional activator
MYQGDYLAENLYDEWAIPSRNRYHRLYFRALIQLLELLKNRNCCEEIVEICEEGFRFEPYEETLYVYYLEALLELGQSKLAANQYKYITAKLYQELGVKSSPALRDIYRKILNSGKKKYEMNLGGIGR